MNIKQIIFNIYLKLKYRSNLKLGKNVRISINSKFYGKNRIYDNVVFNGKMEGGSYIASNSKIFGSIGKYCSIGEDVKVLIGTHPINHVSTSPVFYSMAKQAGYTLAFNQSYEEYIFADKKNNYGIIVGNDVWIGSCVTIIGGVKLGDGAVILANAVVTKDVAPYTIVGGIPAEVIKFRFNQDQIEFLMKLKWWNKDEFWLKQNMAQFDNIDAFIKNNSVEVNNF